MIDGQLRYRCLLRGQHYFFLKGYTGDQNEAVENLVGGCLSKKHELYNGKLECKRTTLSCSYAMFAHRHDPGQAKEIPKDQYETAARRRHAIRGMAAKFDPTRPFMLDDRISLVICDELHATQSLTSDTSKAIPMAQSSLSRTNNGNFMSKLGWEPAGFPQVDTTRVCPGFEEEA